MRKAILAAVVVLSLSACRVDARTSVTVQKSGQGSVTIDFRFDDEAWKQSGGLIPAGTFKRLQADGWKKTETNSKTGHLITLRRSFETPKEGNDVLHSIGKPFETLTLARTTKPIKVSDSLTGSVDLSNGFYGFANDLAPTVPELRSVSDTDVAMKLAASLSGKKAEIPLPWGEATKVRITSESPRQSILLIIGGVLIGLIAILFFKKPVPLGRRIKKDSDG